MDMIPEDVVEDCCQLVKANSIEGPIPRSFPIDWSPLSLTLLIAGSKLNDVKVVYTPWANLKKTQGMEAGAVGFHDEKNKRYRKVVKENVIVNRLKKTKREEKPNLQGSCHILFHISLPSAHLFSSELQRKRLKEINAAQAEAKRKAAQQEKERQDEKRKRDLQKHYQDGFFDEEKMVSNKDLGSNFEEDFM